jgi:16S rRNA processing protein RimM
MVHLVIAVGIICGAHGLRGAVKVKTFTQKPENIVNFEFLKDEKNCEYFLKLIRIVSSHTLIASLKGIDDRTQAEQLQGITLYIDRLQLPEPEEEEFYYTDLIGLSVVSTSGQKLGFVQAVNNCGAGDFLEICDENHHALSIPFTQKAVPVIRMGDHETKGYIQIDPLFLLDAKGLSPEK